MLHRYVIDWNGQCLFCYMLNKKRHRGTTSQPHHRWWGESSSTCFFLTLLYVLNVHIYIHYSILGIFSKLSNLLKLYRLYCIECSFFQGALYSFSSLGWCPHFEWHDVKVRREEISNPLGYTSAVGWLCQDPSDLFTLSLFKCPFYIILCGPLLVRQTQLSYQVDYIYPIKVYPIKLSLYPYVPQVFLVKIPMFS